jgi:uncharacterized protein (TIGR00369 family)
MDGTEPADEVARHFEEHGFLAWLGLEIDAVDPEETVVRVPYDEKLTNSGLGPSHRDELHGGVAATLVDTAAAIACRAGLENPAESGIATIDLDVSYLERAAGDLEAIASVVRVGGTVGVAEVDVYSRNPDDEDALVAVGKGSYRLFRAESD